MKEYYLERFHWIFKYTRKDFLYCLLKTLCVVVGLPIYAAAFVVEMVFTAINMIFSWIPILNVVVMVICKALVWLFGMTFYINILTDLKEYKATRVVQYEVDDAADESPESEEAEVAEQEPTEENVEENRS
ncbi:MAG: hypothetical protein J1F66_03430 [Clostridiales bacterium]|nr:hypothetical protein [Clostridiales bacterium]